ncbi:hypothetical protein LTR36_010702 [Oleoguttula mirabilis]|uniref:Uncharacterized protein n=1 Tax=Oleoguttula mirabilis TaxID=1507867 RepID=A0AAV9JQT4_9PEZI|nr:hypothetical protein LTR36_010702 [Oleoguttula mirabilis]
MARLTLRGPKGKPPKSVHFEDSMATSNSADEYMRQKEQRPSSPAAAGDATEQATKKSKKRKKSTASPPPPASPDEEGDTIAVQQKVKAVEIEDVTEDDNNGDSPLSDIELLEKQLDESPEQPTTASANRPEQPTTVGANRPWGRNGKAPVRGHGRYDGAEDDYEMIDADDADEEAVDEGSIDYNDQGDEDAEDDGDGDKDEVISISSQDDDKEAPPFDIMDRPWKVEGFNRGMRQHWETMYCTVEMRPLGNSWDSTEDYQREKDKEMLRYMEDFALPTWVIPREQAEQAYFRLLERSRWRTLGIRIYGQQRIPEIIPNATPFNRVGQMPFQQQLPLNTHPNQYPQHPQHMQHPQQRQSSMGDSRPPSVAQQQQQQQMQYHPPSNQQSMPPNGMPPNGMPPNGMQPNGMHPNMQPPPPNQMLRSQPHAMPMLVPPGAHQQAMQHQHAMQMMHQQHAMQGHPQMSHAPHGLPYAVGPHMMSHANVPMQAPRPMPFGLPPGMQQMPAPTNVNRPSRRKKETPVPPTPPPPPPTPPYDVRDRPIPRKEFNKTGKRNMRKQAEALDFPWQRKLDFPKARDEAKWDDSGYDRDILDAMTAVRQKNMPIITKLDDELAEKQRMQRAAAALALKLKCDGDTLTSVAGNQRNKKKRPLPAQLHDEQSSDMEKAQSQQPEGGDKKETKRKSENIGGDPYYSGNFSFASEEDRQKALALQRKTPDDIIDDAEAGRIDWELCKEIFICWNPGKKGLTQDLIQAQYRIYDTLITRKQLDSTPILTRRAAECIVDFCPDLLWREMLLRIVSEAGYGNKDVRDRFCYNGCHNDKATITKRIAAALGQKQQNPPGKRKPRQEAAEAGRSASPDDDDQPPPKKGRRGPLAKDKEQKDRYQKGEAEWHAGNKVDFANYTRFFGKRPGARVYPAAGDKRKKSEDADGGSELDTASPSKRAKAEEEDGARPATSDGVEMEVDDSNAAEESDEEESEDEEDEDDEEDEEEAEEEAEEEQAEAADAVSAQGSSVLDDFSD